jgi:hypothetical protein
VNDGITLSTKAVRELQMLLNEAMVPAEAFKDERLTKGLKKAHAFLHKKLPSESLQELERRVFNGS